ncbi:hypothetical protein TELCIR_19464, partial [Teladorsagia circumcincta]
LRSLYTGPIALKQDEYVQVADVVVDMGAKAPEVLPKSTWIDIRIDLSPSTAAIYVDDILAVSTNSLGISDDLLAIKNSSIFLGGVPEDRLLPEDLQRIRGSFAGAVKQLKINERPFSLRG